jgi:MFS family permease
MSDRQLASEARVTSPKVPTRARLGVITIFLAHSLPRTSWVPFIPQIKSSMGVDYGTLGTALLGAPAGSFLAMLVIGPLLPRFGSQRVVAVVLTGYLLTGVGLGLARAPVELFVALFLWGLFQGSLDVAMNAQGVTVERAAGRPVMSGFHASWSIGGFVGVGLGAISVGLGIPLLVHMIILSMLIAIAGLIAVPTLLDDREPETHQPATPAPGEKRRRKPPGLQVLTNRAVIILGFLTLTCMLCEGAVADWSAVYLRETVELPAAAAALGFTAFSITMVAFRLAGDRLLLHWPPRTSLPPMTLIAAAGVALAIGVPGPITSIIGFGLLGVGTALVVPATFSAAGRLISIQSGPAVAAVAAFGWMGYVLGPPLIGHLANVVTLRGALLVVPLLMLTTAIVSRRCHDL